MSKVWIEWLRSNYEMEEWIGGGGGGGGRGGGSGIWGELGPGEMAWVATCGFKKLVFFYVQSSH